MLPWASPISPLFSSEMVKIVPRKPGTWAKFTIKLLVARDVTAAVGGQKQKHFCSLGSKLCFHVNSSSKNSIVLTPNMAALSRGRKPIVKFRTFGSVNDQMPWASPISSFFLG